jgi:hypothetical protein
LIADNGSGDSCVPINSNDFLNKQHAAPVGQ